MKRMSVFRQMLLGFVVIYCLIKLAFVSETNTLQSLSEIFCVLFAFGILGNYVPYLERELTPKSEWTFLDHTHDPFGKAPIYMSGFFCAAFFIASIVFTVLKL